VKLDDPAGDGEPEPRSAHVRGPGRVRTVEALEYALQIVRGDPRTLVRDLEARRRAFGASAEQDPADFG
jgi:hypothetical protein